MYADQKRWFLKRITLDDLTSGEPIYGMRVKKWVGHGQGSIKDPLRIETHWANEDDALDYQDLIMFTDKKMDQFRRSRNRWRWAFFWFFLGMTLYLVLPNVIPLDTPQSVQ